MEIITGSREDLIKMLDDAIGQVDQVKKREQKTGEVVDMLGNFFDKGLGDTLKDWWQDVKKDLKDMITPGWLGGGNDEDSTSVSNSNISYPMRTNNMSPNHP